MIGEEVERVGGEAGRAGRVISSSLTPVSKGRSSFEILYTYDVTGHAYTSSRLAFFTSSGDSTAHLQRYQPGTEVRVYYQPGDPENAVIIPGDSGGLFVVGFGLLFACGGAWLVWKNLRPS